MKKILFQIFLHEPITVQARQVIFLRGCVREYRSKAKKDHTCDSGFAIYLRFLSTRGTVSVLSVLSQSKCMQKKEKANGIYLIGSPVSGGPRNTNSFTFHLLYLQGICCGTHYDRQLQRCSRLWASVVNFYQSIFFLSL